MIARPTYPSSSASTESSPSFADSNSQSSDSSLSGVAVQHVRLHVPDKKRWLKHDFIEQGNDSEMIAKRG